MHSTVIYSTVKYSTVMYSTVKYSTITYSTVFTDNFTILYCTVLVTAQCCSTHFMSVSFSKVDQTRSRVEKSHPLFVFPLFRHLIPEICQLGGELLYQSVRLVQLET